MSVTLEIPESVAAAMRLPKPQLHRELMVELAVGLYADGVLAFGKARELTGVSVYEFAQALGRRGIVRHYDEDELARDIDYAGGQ